jgi:hypothetical protein
VTCRRDIGLEPIRLPGLADPETFTQKVQPPLANVTTSAIATALGVSWELVGGIWG